MVVPKYLISQTLSKEILSVFILWLHHVFCFRDTTMYLVLSAFFSRLISLLGITSASVFLSNSMYASAQYIYFININRSWCVPFNFKPSWLTWTLLMAYFKAKLKSNGGKACPCFEPSLIWNMSNVCLPGLCQRFNLGTFL
jgi:hypothetical protein